VSINKRSNQQSFQSQILMPLNMLYNPK